MAPLRIFQIVALSAASLFISSCASKGPVAVPTDVKPVKAGFVNPYPPGTYEHFTAENYPKTYKAYRNESVLSQTNSSNSHLKISLGKQRAFLMNGDQIAMDYPISSGRSKYPTPSGSFKIVEKLKDKRSNIYGKILDSEGKVVKSNADAREDEIPEGGSFKGASMPYWMRFTWDGIGHHVGRVPRHPASHGCIRGQKGVMPTIFKKTRIGTPVTIE